MSPCRLICTALVLGSTLSGCNLASRSGDDAAPLESALLPAPDSALQIPHLGPCTGTTDRTLHLNANYRVAVLVHGCDASAGRFRSLAQVYAFHGEQAVCFSYDDRDSLVHTADRLNDALAALESHMLNRNVTLIGHSMGGLVARKAMESARTGDERAPMISLVTVSAPLAGIAHAKTCGNRPLRFASLGAVALICWAITGDNWSEVTATSDFIQHPQPLAASVQHYLKVVTNERGTCRRRSTNGACAESDFTFSLPEQYQPIIDGYPRLTNVQIDAGHVEIIGYRDVAPRKLLGVLQAQGLMPSTPPQRAAALERLLAALY